MTTGDRPDGGFARALQASRAERSELQERAPLPSAAAAGRPSAWEPQRREWFAKDALLGRDDVPKEPPRESVLLVRVEDGRLLEANPAALEAYGYDLDQFLTLTFHELHPPDERAAVAAHLADAGVSGSRFETVHLGKNGTRFPVEVTLTPLLAAGSRTLVGVIRDTTGRRRLASYRAMGRTVLGLLSEPGDWHSALRRVLEVVRETTQVRAVGIRLQDGDDFPYFCQEGFSEDFLRKENSLLVRNRDGGVCLDENGKVSLECTCGLVLAGKTDPSNALFTPGGSSWTNNSFPFLEVPRDQDPRTNPRNECIHQGYASVALVPIRAKGAVVGLLQLNDRRKDQFSLEAVECLEEMAESIGEALLRKQAEEALRGSEARYGALLGALDGFIYSCSPERRIEYMNEALKARTGRDATGEECFRALHGRDDVCPWCVNDQVFAGETVRWEVESPLDHRWYRVVNTPVRGRRGAVSKLAVVEDVTEQRKAREETESLLEQARRDGETRQRLLHELNHRVKNNLVGLLGLLLAEEKGAPPEGRPWVEASTRRMGGRIRVLLAVHQILSSVEWAPLLLSELAERLIRQCLGAGAYQGHVSLEVTPSPVLVSPRQASALGLLLNELAMNTLLHALPHRDHVRVRVRIEEEDDSCLLQYGDDGPGFPQAVLAGPLGAAGLGLVASLAAGTLRGALELANDGGALATVRVRKEDPATT